MKTCVTGLFRKHACTEEVYSKHTSRKLLIRVSFMGSGKVGKTTIVRRLIGKSPTSQYKPTVFDFYQNEVTVDKQNIALEISDTSGSYQFPVMDKLTTENTDVLVIVFSLSNLQSYGHALKIFTSLRENQKNLPIIFVGNKNDISLRKCAMSSEIENYITCKLNKTYMEMSAKRDNGDKLLRRIYEEYEVSHGPYYVNITTPSTLRRMKSRIEETFTRD